MNKRELIDYCNVLKESKNRFINCIDVDRIIDTIKQLDEPRPVKVKQFVADWITHSKNIGRSLFGAMSIFEENFEIKKWMQWAENQEIFARAWLDGYEVEEEKRYRISMPKTRNYMNHAQILCEKDGKIFWCGEWHPFRTKFTRKELEGAGFGWVFDCPGIEIEEVEECLKA